MKKPSAVAYYRVSTVKQGKSGLGLDAQRRAVEDFMHAGAWELIGEFVEVESGKLDRRPELEAALAQCDLTGATLIVAKLDRLSRNVAFLATLKDSGTRFLAVDMPTLMAGFSIGHERAPSVRQWCETSCLTSRLNY